MINLLCQIDNAIETGGQILTGRSEALIVLVALLLFAGGWVWKVVIPERKAAKEKENKFIAIQHSQAETLAALGNVSAKTSEDSYAARKNTDMILTIKELEVDCFKKIEKAIPEVNITEELAKISGVIKVASSNTKSN